MPILTTIRCGCGRQVDIPPPKLGTILRCTICGDAWPYYGGRIRIAPPPQPAATAELPDDRADDLFRGRPNCFYSAGTVGGG